MKKHTTNCGKIDISSKIGELRLKLYKTYEKQGISREVIRISQELDMCIYYIQQELIAMKEKKD